MQMSTIMRCSLLGRGVSKVARHPDRRCFFGLLGFHFSGKVTFIFGVAVAGGLPTLALLFPVAIAGTGICQGWHVLVLIHNIKPVHCALLRVPIIARVVELMSYAAAEAPRSYGCRPKSWPLLSPK